MSAADKLLSDPDAEQVEPSEGNAADTHPGFQPWLAWLGEIVADARCVALIGIDAREAVGTQARWPQSCTIDDTALALAARACRHGATQRMVIESNGDNLLALPLPGIEADAQARRALLLVTGALSRQQQRALLGLADWAAKSLVWLDNAPRGLDLPEHGCDKQVLREPEGLSRVLDRLAERYGGAHCAVTRLERRGRGRLRARVMCISGQGRIDASRPAVRKLALLVESLYADPAQPPVPTYDESTTGSAGTQDSQRDAEPLFAIHFLLPVSVCGQLHVLSLQCAASESLSLQDRNALARDWGPVLQSALLLEQQSQPMLQIVRARLASWYRQCMQRGARTLLHALLLAGIAGFVLVPVDKRVSADVLVQAAERHALIAPMDAFVKSVQARAGDRVAQGDLLATLNDEDLLGQVDKWEAEQQKNQQDYQRALALHDRVQLSALRENKILIETELAQVRARLLRHEIRAPLSGIVLSDSVEDALGSAVKSGDVLFEVGSASKYRLALQMPERSIGQIETGQAVTLRMTADPKQRRTATVDGVIPVAQARQGQNTFTVYASPDSVGTQLRPGMKGIGKVLVGHQSRLSQWTASLWSRLVWLAWKLGMSG